MKDKSSPGGEDAGTGGKTLGSFLADRAKRLASKAAISSKETQITYARLEADSNRIANGLLRHGLTGGDRVAMLLANSPEYLVAYFGIVKAGGVAVPLDTGYQAAQLVPLLQEFEPRLLFTERRFWEALGPVVPDYAHRVVDLAGEVSGSISYRELLETSPEDHPGVEPDPEDTATILCTSGTTGRPKGVMFSHRNLMASGATTAAGFGLREEDICALFIAPLFHLWGLASASLTTFSIGGTLVMVTGTGAEDLLRSIHREGITVVSGVPGVYMQMLNLPEAALKGYDLTSVRQFQCGGAALPQDTLERFRSCFGLSLTQGWALTEAGSWVTAQPLDGSGKVGSVGKVIPGFGVKVVDEQEREVPPSQEGEILVRGATVMKGYYNSPRATQECLREGWLHTMDLGKMDEDGFLYVTGRKQEVMTVAGHTVHPRDVEEVLYRHPKVVEVGVVGVTDPAGKTLIKAVIVLKPGETATDEEIEGFCRQRLRDYEVPQMVEFAGWLPKTPTGKVRRLALREHGAHQPTAGRRQEP